MIGPIAREGEAPALPAAAALVAGILLGSRSVTGELLSAMLILATGCWLFLMRNAPRRFGSRALALGLLWLAAGFLSGRLRIAVPAETARRTFSSLSSTAASAVRVEGMLTDYWFGAPPQVRGRLRATAIGDTRHPSAFPAEVFLFAGGGTPVASLADRGDRVILTGHLRPEDVPASERDVVLPWTRYRLSVKSARLVEPRGRTLASWLQMPNRLLFASMPMRGPAFERQVRGPLAALLLGRTSELDRGMVARYRRGGLYHLLVVSGLHVALAAGLVFWALRAAGVRGKARDACLLAAVVAIVLVGGANPPAVRAGLVFTIFLLARLLERPIRGTQAAGLSAVVLFLAAPAEVFSIGCVLTFAAVAGIALFSAPIRSWLPGRPAWLFTGLATALAAEIATAPVLLWRFNLLAAGAWLTAPLSIPLSGGLIALGALVLVLFAFGVFPTPLVSLFAAGARLLEWLAERAGGVAFLRPTPPLAGVLAVGTLTLGAALGPRRLRPWSAALAAALFLILALRPGPGGPESGFSLEALDVGQGDALLLRWGRHALLVDGGGPFDLDARDFGRTRLLPKLLDRGVTALDAVLLSHPHPDHALGLFAVLDELSVGRVWRSAGEDEGGLNAALEAAARQRGVPVSVLEAGTLDIGGARLTVLQSGGPRRKRDSVNDQSVVAVFERGGRRALLTGDAGAAAEEDLLDAGAVSAVDVLKVGHHGSRGSTTAAFLEAACPRLALLSCGRENRFGHPAPETLAALEARRIPVYRTDLCSDVRVDLLPGATRLRLRGLP
ncbi:MAG TPA: ComEC/Rec2 family competence protein [Thermoanaerobaculia bacterium]|nr:ComEC/Rec2 family competence protein [Thermoanaerobaculia bacterium]